MSYGLGVDLGTSFTGAAVTIAGKTRMVPLGDHTTMIASIAWMKPDGVLVVGDESALNEQDPSTVVKDFKRRLGDPTPMILGGQTHSAASLLSATLTSVIHTVTEAEGTTPDRLVLTCPAVWGPYRREQFDEVPRRADQNNVQVITEPEAAATYYAANHNLSTGDTVAIYDLGGGTFDTTVTRITDDGATILGLPEGLEWVGGIDFDEAIFAHIDQQLGGSLTALNRHDPTTTTCLQRVRRQCIEAKETLSRQDTASILIPLPHKQEEIQLTRTQFDTMIRPPLEATIAALTRTLASAELQPSDLTAILLVGGSARIPLITTMLTAAFPCPILLDPHPQRCVALGAAILAGREPEAADPVVTRQRPPIVPVQVSARVRPNRWSHRTRALVALTAVVLLTGTGVMTARALRPDPHDSASGSASSSDPISMTATDSPDVATATSNPGATSSPRPRVKKHHSALPLATKSTPEKTKNKPKPKPTASDQVSAASSMVGQVGELVGVAGECADVGNAQPVENNVVQLYACNQSPAQIWSVTASNTIQALNMCLTAGGPVGAAQPSNGVVIDACDGRKAQQWAFVSKTLVNRGLHQCLGELGDATADRTPLITQTCSGSAGQKWHLRGLS